MSDEMTDDMKTCWYNIIALLTEVLHPAVGPHDELWAHTLTQPELADTSGLMAKLIITLWLQLGMDPEACIAGMVKGAPK